MAGWFPVPDEGWSDAIEALGVELPRALAVADLRWWARQVLAPGSKVRMPTYRRLAERWRWGEKRTRLLMADEAAWVDPLEAERWQGRTEGASGAQAGRTEGATDNGSTVAIQNKGRTEGASGAQAGRTEGDTRVVVTPDPRPLTPDIETLFAEDMKRLEAQGVFGQPKAKRTRKPKVGVVLTTDEESVLSTYQRVFNGDTPSKPEWEGIRKRLPEVGVAGVAAFLEGLASHPGASWWRDQGPGVQSVSVWRDAHFMGLYRKITTASSKGGTYHRPSNAPLPLLQPVDDDGVF